jgi:uncharacterized FAD-dependent dehydrogenase
MKERRESMIKTEIRVPCAYSSEDVLDRLTAHLPLSRQEITDIQTVKKELVIDGDLPSYRLTVAFSLSSEREAGLLKMKKKVSEHRIPSLDMPLASESFGKSVVVGAGPAGLFAALTLARAGARPILIERGEDVDSRAVTVGNFFSKGLLSESSNIQFGEGGAGTFSDGKLKVGAMDKYKWSVLSTFVSFGAPSEILYLKGAHLGTDRLPDIVKGIREEIKSLGGSVMFGTTLTDIRIKDGKVTAAVCQRGGEQIVLDAKRIILATGHSAHDTLEMLLSKSVKMESRGFGIGMRIEHKREYINKLIYKNDQTAEICGSASYHLVTHLPTGRSVYSFCMCPGGVVVPATSRNEGVVTNGMSEYSRMADNSNAAMLVSVSPDDFGSDSPLAGIELQRRIERAAYVAAGGGYRAPAEMLSELLSGDLPRCFGDVTPSYAVGVVPTRAEEYLPSYITESLKRGILDFDDWLPGFALGEATLTGAETRSTSPVRIQRDPSFESTSVKGLYPIGEGAGYSGGIVSSATDGVRCAEAILLSRTDR